MLVLSEEMFPFKSSDEDKLKFEDLGIVKAYVEDKKNKLESGEQNPFEVYDEKEELDKNPFDGETGEEKNELDDELDDENLRVFNELSDVNMICNQALSLVPDVEDLFNIHKPKQQEPIDTIPHKTLNSTYFCSSSDEDSEKEEIKEIHFKKQCSEYDGSGFDPDYIISSTGESDSEENISEVTMVNDKSGRSYDESERRNDESEKRNDESVRRNNEVIRRNDESIRENDESDRRNDESNRRKDDSDGRNDESERCIDESDEERLFYLMNDNCNIFLGKLVPGKVVHNRVLEGSERRFLISVVINAEKWKQFDKDRHTVGAYIAWDLKSALLKVKKRKPVASLASIIPRETLLDYQKHVKDGCDLVCLGSGLEECRYQNDKVYNEWYNLMNVAPGPSPKKKRRRGKIDKKKENKRLKNEGKAYTTTKGVQKAARKPMQWVDCKCAYKCANVLDIEERKILYEKFWGIPEDQRRQYIVSHQISTCPKHVTTKGSSRRKQTIKYFFHGTKGQEIPVCSKVFHATLQITPKFVRYAREKSSQGISQPDRRGRHIPSHKLKEATKINVLDHINSFHKVESHYSRKSSKKIYIEDTTNFSKLTVSRMHQLYLVKCRQESVEDTVGLASYKKIFKENNFKIHKPKKDQCKICTKYQRSKPEQKAKQEEAYRTHVKNKEIVLVLKEEYKTKGKDEKNLLVFNFDLEAVLYTPCDKVSTIFYMRKLCTYNCTAYNLVTRNGYCYIWDESEGKRGSNEIGTSLYMYLEGFKGNEVVMFSDTCGGQNRNQYIAELLLYIVRSHRSIQSIDYIFMVQGHSHMEVDSMHSAIEKKSGGLQIYDPYGWAVVASIARKDPYYVETLKHQDIFDLKRLKVDMKVSNVNQNTEGDKAKWKGDNSITWMRFEKEKPGVIMYKTTYDKEEKFKEIVAIKQSKRRSLSAELAAYCMPRAYSERLAISKKKLKDLKKLCKDNTIPPSHWSFYEGLKGIETIEAVQTDESSSGEDEAIQLV